MVMRPEKRMAKYVPTDFSPSLLKQRTVFSIIYFISSQKLLLAPDCCDQVAIVQIPIDQMLTQSLQGLETVGTQLEL